MNNVTAEGWCKGIGAAKSSPMGTFSFHLNEAHHRRLEEAEERLAKTDETEIMVEVEAEEIELSTPPECGPLSDCKIRVYRGGEDMRGQFHLVGHRASDGSLVYTNAVMVDQLG